MAPLWVSGALGKSREGMAGFAWPVLAEGQAAMSPHRSVCRFTSLRRGQPQLMLVVSEVWKPLCLFLKPPPRVQD